MHGSVVRLSCKGRTVIGLRHVMLRFVLFEPCHVHCVS